VKGVGAPDHWRVYGMGACRISPYFVLFCCAVGCTLMERMRAGRGTRWCRIWGDTPDTRQSAKWWVTGKMPPGSRI